MNPDELDRLTTELRESLNSLKSVISAFTAKVNSVVEEFNGLNNKALSINRSYTDVASRGVAATEGLTLTLNSKFSIGLELNRQALFGNNRELVKLAATQEALGKSSAPTIAAFRELQVGLRLSDQQTNDLAKVTLDASLRYGISTEVLVNQLQKLLPVMETLSLAGQDTSQFASFVSELTAKLGGERNADNVARALTILTDVSSKNQNMLARFGVQDISRRLISGKGSPEEQSALAVEAIRRFALGVQSMQGSQIENIRLLQEVSGGTAGLFLSLNNELETTANNIKENDPTEMFNKLMKNFQNSIDAMFAPIREKVMEAVSVLVEGAKPVIEFIAGLIKSFSEMKRFTDLLIIGFISIITILIAALVPTLISLVSAFAALIVPLLPLIAVVAALGLAVYAVMRIFDFGFSDIFSELKKVFNNFGDYMMLIVYRLAQGFYSLLSSVTFGGLSESFENDSLEYQRKADALRLKIDQSALDASQQIEKNTRKEIKIPDFIKTTNKELEDAFRVMLGLQSTNPVAAQMAVLNDNMQMLVENSNVQTENSTQTVQAQNQTVQKLELVNQTVKKPVTPLTRYPNSSRAF